MIYMFVNEASTRSPYWPYWYEVMSQPLSILSKLGSILSILRIVVLGGSDCRSR